MKIALFVHDCFLEIGHSHSMIEILRNMPPQEIERIDIVCFTCADPLVLFPCLKGKVFFRKVPFPNLYPVLFKVIFYHIWTFIFSLSLEKSTKKIGIGIASLSARIINVQFVHSQWSDYFFANKRMPLFTMAYKKILFFYFKTCEKFLYSRKNIKLGVLSSFVSDYCKEFFLLSSKEVYTIYSGINLTKYAIDQRPRREIYQSLCKTYPQLHTIDPDRPIYLFVGAYERKGLPVALKALQSVEEPQIIVIGSPASGEKFHFPKDVSIAAITFTKELPLFYSLADIFVFPTSYEPFGLVITEAVAMGMEVYITQKNVGATEILHNLKKVHIFNEPQDLEFQTANILGLNERLSLRHSRIEQLKKYSWEKSSQEFYKLLQLSETSS